MPETDVGNITTTDLTNQLKDYSVDPKETDAATDQKETRWINQEWSKQWGYYNKIPELREALDAKSRWIIGRGWTADPQTTIILMGIKGIGKDTFNTIIENQKRIAALAGDSFAEIITNKKDTLINLKPLDPGKIVTVANRKGIIIRYDLVKFSIVEGKTQINWVKGFEPEKIFHLSRNRGADEIHGISIIPAIEEIILMRNEAMEDWRIVLHRNVVPLRVLEVDEDDTAKLATLKTQYETAIKNREVIIIPKGTVEIKEGTVAPNATLNPLPWIDMLNDYFFQVVNIPSVILGSSKNLTEASVKIAFMAFQRSTEEDQRELEEQILSQLNLEVKFEFPAIIQNEMLSEKPEEPEAATPEVEEETAAIEPNETKVEMEGRT